LLTGNTLNTKTFTSLLAQPQKLTKDNLDSLATVLDKYPYFQSARALQLKGLKDQHSFLYNDALKVAAAHTTDRDILFEYITSETFIQNEISQEIIKHDISTHQLQVVTEDITEQVSVEIDNQIKAELKKAEAILNPNLFQRKLQSIENSIEEDTSEKKEITPEKILEIDTPLTFKKEDTHSFSEWLQLTKATPIKRDQENIKNDDEKDRKFELIDRFIKEKPKMKPAHSTTENKNLAAPYTETSDSLMTETLAKVYLQQKNYKKAIQAYKILILKNPEKSGFFADQIRAIKKLINTEES